jgi:hypothetical protein
MMVPVKPRKKKPARPVPVFEIPQLVPRQEPERLFPKFVAAFLGGILGGLVVLLAGKHWVESRLPVPGPPARTQTGSRADRPDFMPARPRHAPAKARVPAAVPTAAESDASRALGALLQEGQAIQARLDPCRDEPSDQEAADLSDAWKDKCFAELTRLDPDLVAVFDKSASRNGAHVPAACERYRDAIASIREDMQRHLSALAEIRRGFQGGTK